ncbi:hypothetical protein ABK040_001773 [Willaertia magna]
MSIKGDFKTSGKEDFSKPTSEDETKNRKLKPLRSGASSSNIYVEKDLSNWNGSDIDEDELDRDISFEGLEQKKRKQKDEVKRSPRPELQKQPEVIDDFIRNFFVKKGMEKSLAVFQDEWYEKQQRGELTEITESVPDVYSQLQMVEEELLRVKSQLEQQKQYADLVAQRYEKLKKVKDHHKMNHLQMVQQKDQLRKELERLKKHCSKYDPFVEELTNKYDKVFKEKALVCLERDRLLSKVNELENNKQSVSIENTNESEKTKRNVGTKTPTKKIKKKDSVLPLDKKNPYKDRKYNRTAAESFALSQVYEGHTMSISGVAIHPKKPIVATVSDDSTWKAWSLPTTKVIMSGEGHTDWVSGIDFHPFGTHLATCGGDSTVKLWDFANACCSLTFEDHTLPVWECQFHYSGDFLVSCSMDQTSKLFDIRSEKCITTFRGHKDSVNSIVCVPFTNTILTASADKSISYWDMRADSKSLCVQTYYGHKNSCNCVAINLQGDTIASTDCDGNVILWDLKTQKIRAQFNASHETQVSANKCSFDPSGKVLAVACSDGSVKLYPGDGQTTRIDEDGNKITITTFGELRGHKEGAETVKFDIEGKYLISGGSDSVLCLYN